jgi:putative ABC transport system permease protein
VTAFNVRIAQGRDQAALAEAQRRLSQRFPQLTFTDVEFVPQQNEMYRVWRGMAWAVSLVGLAMGLVMVLNTLLVAVLERTREIGVLVALGWPRRRILWMVVLEGLMLTFAGGLVGIAAGTVALTVLSTHPKLRGFIEVSTSPHAALQHFLAVVVLGLAGAIYPAWRATRLNPIDALREP